MLGASIGDRCDVAVTAGRVMGVALAVILSGPAMAPASSSTGSTRALDVLALIVVENEQQNGYNRDLFAEGLDVDGDAARHAPRC